MKSIVSTAAAPSAELPYRPCVGIMLVGRHGRVWIGARRPRWLGEEDAPIWQMPQGGIEKGEAPLDAALRELREETGVANVALLGEVPRWLSYDLPPQLVGVALKGRYRGQRQRWFAMRHLGDDAAIDIRGRKGCKAEFDDWRWADIDEVPAMAVPYKRDLYCDVVAAFRDLV